MPKLKTGTILPTQAEEAAMQQGIAADEDSRELDDAWFAEAQPAQTALPPDIYAALTSAKRNRGRPKAEETKVYTAIRLDADVVAAFRATGQGWQTRINAALRQYLDEHPLMS